MKKMENISCWMMLLISLMSFSCAEKPVFLGITDIEPIGIIDSTFQISMDFIMYNPNSFGSKLEQSDINVYFDGEWMGIGSINNKVDLKSRDTVYLEVISHIELDKLARFYPELIESDSTEFIIQAESKMSFMMKSFKVKIQDRITVNTKQIIVSELNKYLGDTKEVNIKSLNFDQLPGISRTSFNAVISYGSNIPFDYTLRDMKVAIHLNNSSSPVANWILDSPIYQKANSASEIPMAIDIDNIRLLSAMNINMLFSQKVQLKLVGSAIIEIQGHQFNIPVETNTSFPIKDLTKII